MRCDCYPSEKKIGKEMNRWRNVMGYSPSLTRGFFDPLAEGETLAEEVDPVYASAER